jgi:hypothetical protein
MNWVATLASILVGFILIVVKTIPGVPVVSHEGHKSQSYQKSQKNVYLRLLDGPKKRTSLFHLSSGH